MENDKFFQCKLLFIMTVKLGMDCHTKVKMHIMAIQDHDAKNLLHIKLNVCTLYQTWAG
jgi:hypothetical protein